MYTFTSTILLEAFLQLWYTATSRVTALHHTARPKPPDGPLTAIGAGMSMPLHAFESPFALKDLSRSSGSWELSDGEA